MSEMREDRDDSFIEAVRALLDESARDLDAMTGARLAAARRRALERLEPPLRLPWLLPAGVFASAAAAMLALTLWNAAPAPGPELADVEVLAGPEALELYQDLEFYEWLDADAQAEAG